MKIKAFYKGLNLSGHMVDVTTNKVIGVRGLVLKINKAGYVTMVDSSRGRSVSVKVSELIEDSIKHHKDIHGEDSLNAQKVVDYSDDKFYPKTTGDEKSMDGNDTMKTFPLVDVVYRGEIFSKYRYDILENKVVGAKGNYIKTNKDKYPLSDDTGKQVNIHVDKLGEESTQNYIDKYGEDKLKNTNNKFINKELLETTPERNIIPVYYSGEHFPDYELDIDLDVIIGKRSGKELTVSAKGTVYIYNDNVVKSGAKFEDVKKESLIMHSGTDDSLINVLESNDEPSTDAQFKEVPDTDSHMDEIISQTSIQDIWDMSTKVETKEEPKIEGWVSVDIMNSKAMEILDTLSKEEYDELYASAKKDCELHDLTGGDEIIDMMVQLVVVKYVEPLIAIESAIIKDEYEHLTYNQIANEIGISPIDTEDTLKTHWFNAIRRTYVDKLVYSRDFVTLREFKSILCSTDTVQEVVGLSRLLERLYGKRDILYK